MARRYTGGFISAKEQATDSNTANGVFTLAEAQEKTALGNFPTGRWTPQRSLRFKSASTAYLNRTPNVTGSTVVFTISMWVKRSTLGVQQSLIGCGTNSTNNFSIYFDANDRLNLYAIDNGIQRCYLNPNQVFRDPSAWYHIVVNYNDVTSATSSSRASIFINGQKVTSFANESYPPGNAGTYWSAAGYPHNIGTSYANSDYFNGYLTEIYSVNNQILDPTYFGQTDPETGTWVPKLYTGTFGTNGFYLPFSDNSSLNNLGFDKSTLSTELITNGSFPTDVSGWTVNPATGGSPSITWVSGAARITNSQNNGSIYYQAIPTTIGNTYYVRGYVSNISIGGSSRLCKIQWSNSVSSGFNDIGSVAQSSGSGWISGTFVATATTTYIQLNVDILGTGNQGADWDMISVSETGYKNHFNVNNFSVTGNYGNDSVVDVPGIASVSSQNDIGGVQRGNYCTLNPLAKSTGSGTATLSYGNTLLRTTDGVNSTPGAYAPAAGTMMLTSGKWYFETISLFSTGGFGITSGLTNKTDFNFSQSNWYIAGSIPAANRLTYSDGAGAWIGFAYDADKGLAWYSINNVWQNGNPASGTGGQVLPAPAIPVAEAFYATGSATSGIWCNFGQVAFNYTPPAGFKSLCTTNLPTPIIKRSNDHFDVKTWTGNGNTIMVGNNSKQTTAVAISNGTRFKTNNTYLSKGFQAAGTSNQKWTISVWVKPSFNTSSQTNVFNAANTAANSHGDLISWYNGQIRVINYVSAAFNYGLYTTAYYQDNTQWHNLVVSVDTTQTVASNRIKVYFDGVQITSFSTANYPSQNFSTYVNTATTEYVGAAQYGGSLAGTWEGGMSQFYKIDGQQLDPTYFGQFDANNNWVPKTYTGTYGNNGYYLPLTKLTSADTINFAGAFNGSTNLLKGNSSTTVLGTSDFTVECWVYKNTTSNAIFFAQLSNGSTGRNGIALGYQSGKLWLLQGNGSSWSIETTQGFIPINQWVHIAVSRTGGNTYYFIDGKLCYTYAGTINLASDNNGDWSLGAVGTTSSTAYWDGYISNFRLIKGTGGALYTSNFTPSSSPLTAVTNTQLLTLNSGSIVDNSTNAMTITNTNSVSLVDASPWQKTIGSDSSGNNNLFYPTGFDYSVPKTTVVTYATPGTYTWTAPAGVTAVKVLVIGGGGAGGSNGGGGGAGGMVYNGNYSVTPGTPYTVTVGRGGLSRNRGNAGDSVFGTITAYKGGNGATYAVSAAQGGNGTYGSGGGGCLNSNAGGAGTTGQGNNGGTGNNGNSGNTYYGAGGGGAGAAGTDGGSGGAGGIGLINYITGMPLYYAGGGGGNYFSTNTPYYGAGGAGGGGSGNNGSGVLAAGINGTGGGGGATSAGTGGGMGGCGTVIIAYTNAYTYSGTGANTILTSDVMPDSPTDTANADGTVSANYATIDTNQGDGGSYGFGGLFHRSAATDQRLGLSTLNMANTNGKFYAEVTMSGSSSTFYQCGVFGNPTTWNPRLQYRNDGYAWIDGNNVVTNWASYTDGDVIGIAFDSTTATATFYKNGTLQGSLAYTGTAFTGTWKFGGGSDGSGGQNDYNWNFGQKQFLYTVPTGYLPLSSKSLRHFGGYNLPDSFGNFVNTPDLVWIKNRTSTYNHILQDTVRGTNNYLDITTSAISITTTGVQSFLPNGFQVGSIAGANNAGNNIVGWAWNRGTTPGFDIVTHTGTGAAQTINHGLGTAPSMIITKYLGGGASGGWAWIVYHKSLSSGTVLYLQATTAPQSLSAYTSVNNTSFTLGTESAVNLSGAAFVNYLWAEVPGFSKFGSYTGNGSSDGPFIYTGFRPKFILYKRTDTTSDWKIIDSARNAANPVNSLLGANITSAEDTNSAYDADFTSNGYKIRYSLAGANASGGTYIYAAFAETPFKYANAR